MFSLDAAAVPGQADMVEGLASRSLFEARTGHVFSIVNTVNLGHCSNNHNHRKVFLKSY